MHGMRYAESLKIETFRESGWHRSSGGSPARSDGISTPLLYACIRLQSEQFGLLAEIDALRSEVRQLKHELQGTTEERDMLRNGYRVLSVTVGAQQRKPKPAPEPRRTARARAPDDAEMRRA